MKSILIALLLLIMPCSLFARQGKLTLRNGCVIKGDIVKLGDGRYLVSNANFSISFESNEVKNIQFFPKTVKRKNEPAYFSFSKTTSSEKKYFKKSNNMYDHLIYKEARKNDIDPALLKAVIKTESNFNAKDTSNKGACGLMQLMPDTAKKLGVKDIYSPSENIGGGARYLKEMIYFFNGNLDLALAAYNCGPKTVCKYKKKIPPYEETRNFVKKVRYYYRVYRTPGIHTYKDDKGSLNIYNVR